MTIIIFANGKVDNENVIKSVIAKIKDEYKIIACDGAAEICEKFGIMPDLIVGDFDSYKKEFANAKKIKLSDQNYTDLQKAIEFSKKFNPEKYIIFGAFGKRLDHTIANLLLFYYQTEILMDIYDDYGAFKILNNGFHALNYPKDTLISFFALSKIKKLTLRGFKYNFLDKTELDYFIGISNLTKESKQAVSFVEGRLILYIPFNSD